MLFRKTARRIQVLVYDGYKPEKKRSSYKLLGSFGAYSYELSDELKNNASADQMAEVQAHIESLRQADKNNMRLHDCRFISRSLNEAAAALSAGEFEGSPEWAAEVYTQMDALAKAMRRAGMKRPAKPAAPVAAAPAGQLDLVEHQVAPQALDSQAASGLDQGPQGGPTNTGDPQGGGQGWGYAGDGFNPA